MKTKLDIQKIQNFINKFNETQARKLEIDEEYTGSYDLVLGCDDLMIFQRSLNILIEEFGDKNPLISRETIIFWVNNREYWL